MIASIQISSNDLGKMSYESHISPRKVLKEPDRSSAQLDLQADCSPLSSVKFAKNSDCASTPQYAFL